MHFLPRLRRILALLALTTLAALPPAQAQPATEGASRVVRVSSGMPLSRANSIQISGTSTPSISRQVIYMFILLYHFSAAALPST